MEKLGESYDKENMKMAMLRHEETFRQQVYELHRLYRIQKMLMKNIDENMPRRDRWNRKNEVFSRQKELDLEQPADEDQIIDESEIELTLGPSSYNQGRKKKAETKLTSDSGPSFSSSSTGSSQGNRGPSAQTRNYREIREQLIGGPEMGFVGFVESNDSGYQRGNINSSSVDVEEEMRHLRQHPWLYQAVSLNLT